MTEKRTSSARALLGFTLAELLIVTGIVSILVAVSIPIMSGQVQKAKEVRAKAEARILCMALWMYLHDLDEQDIHPESWELMMELGYAPADTPVIVVSNSFHLARVPAALPPLRPDGGHLRGPHAGPKIRPLLLWPGGPGPVEIIVL